MLTIKERIAGFLVIIIFMVILLSPAKGYCAALRGNLLTPAKKNLPGAFIYLYDWVYVQQGGLSKSSPFYHLIGKTGPSVEGENFYDFKTGQRSIGINEDDFPTDKEYCLIISTQDLASTKSYATFFYGAYNEGEFDDPNRFRALAQLDMSQYEPPRVSFGASGVLNLGDVFPPNDGINKGFYLFGSVKDGNVFKKGVGLEIYIDQNGVATRPPYPFYRFVRTGDESELGSTKINFQIGGLVPNTTYYLKIIGNDLGYIDDFFEEDDLPRKFVFTNDHIIAGDFTLTKGASISGYIRDEGGNPVNNSVISIDAASDTGLVNRKYLQDPGAERFADYPESFRIFAKIDQYNFTENGYYEMKGLPFEDQNFTLSATELPMNYLEEPYTPDTSSMQYATPVFCDENGCTSEISEVKNISFAGPVNITVNFSLKDCACIKGYIAPEIAVSNNVKTALGLTDPNIFEKPNIQIVAYQKDNYGLPTIMRQLHVEERFGDFTLCGLFPGEYIIVASDTVTRNDPYSFYPAEFYDNQPIYNTATWIDLDYGDTYRIVTEEQDPNVWSLSLGGMISGRVLDPNGLPIENAVVFVNQINLGQPLVGYYFSNSEGTYFYPPLQDETDSDGKYYFYGLPEGSYTILVNGFLKDSNGYLRQFYDSDNTNAAMMSNQVYPQFVEDNIDDFKTLEDFRLVKAGSESGGVISGQIRLDESLSEEVPLLIGNFFLHLHDYNTKVLVSDSYYQVSIDGNDLLYSIVVPDDGEYVLSVQDSQHTLLPHYFKASQTTIDPDLADILYVDNTQPLTNKDFQLSTRAGEISGQALDPNSKGILGLLVSALQEIKEGPGKGVWKSVRQAETNLNGEFTISGLYKGTYIFLASDPYYRYPPTYNKSNIPAYTPDDAETRTYSPGGNITLPSIEFNLERVVRIKGKVNENFVGTRVFVYLIEDGKQTAEYVKITADPDFSFPEIPPGKYIISFSDPNQVYLPIYYKGKSGSPPYFTTDLNEVDPNGTQTPFEIDAEVSFSQYAAEVKGKIMNSDSDPVPRISVSLYRMSGQKEIWDKEPVRISSSDPNGNFTFKSISVGDYKIVAYGGLSQYSPISKSLTINASDLGTIKTEGVELVFPLNWTNKKYSWNLRLEKGLNLSAYPSRMLPLVQYPLSIGYTPTLFLKDILLVNKKRGMTLRSYSADKKEWNSFSYDKALLDGAWFTDFYSSSARSYLSNGQGFMLYSQEERTVNFFYYPGQTSLSLKRGLNLVGNVAFDPEKADVIETDFVSDPEFTTRKMLSQMGEDNSVSIQTFEAKAGKWQASYWMWGKSAGAATEVKDELGYLVTMKEELNNWYPTNNN